jgi:tetratricopeptide (TPR) repeat protein
MFITKRTKSKRAAFLMAVVAICATAALAAPAARWLFTNEEEMQQTVTVQADNPRAAYYIILRASKQGLGPQTCVAYHDLLKKNPYDPYLQATYAFSQYMATRPFSERFFSGERSDLEKEIWKQQAEAIYYRDEAIKAKPDSAVILVETALPLHYGYGNNSTKAVEHLRKAARIAPDWADTYYWLGKVLSDYWANSEVPKEKRAEIAREAIASLDRAIKLEPKLREDCLMSYSGAYQALDRPDKSLVYRDEYCKSHPDFAKRPEVVKGRQWLVDEAKKKGLLKDDPQAEKPE